MTKTRAGMPIGERLMQMSPVRFVAALLATAFVTEIGIMFVLPVMFSTHASGPVVSGVDAMLLVVVLAPVLWWMIIRPFQSGETARHAAQHALAESEERLRLALVAANQGLYDLDVQTGEAVVSPEYATMLGYDPAEFHESMAAWTERMHPDDRERVAGVHRDYLAGRLPVYRVEFQQRTKTGDWRWILSQGKIVERAPDGRPLRMLGTHTDITERKRAEQALRESEVRYRSLFENMLNGYAYCRMLYDDHGRPVDFVYLDVNEAVERLTGLKGVVGKPVSEVIPEIRLLSPELFDVFGRVASTGVAETFEFDFKSQNQWLTISVFSPEKGNFVAIFDDISERKRAEQALVRLVAIIEATPDMVATGDPNGHALYYNRAGLRMLGFEPGLDLSTVRLLDTHPDWAAKLVAETGIPHAIKHGTWSGETALLRRDGREIPVSQVIIAHKRPDGSVEYLSTIARDITLQKEHEKRIMRLNRVYAVLGGINETIVRTRDQQELFDEVCRIAVELGKFRLAWIGLLDANGVDVTPVARAGVDEGYLDNIRLTVRDDAPDRCELVALALREKTVVVCNDIDTDPQMAHWREEALRRDYRSVVVFPLQREDKVAGLLALYASEAGFFDTEEMRLLTNIASNISFALDHIEKETELRLQSDALNAAANAIVITDRNGTIEWVNTAFTALTGYRTEEAIGKKQSELSKSGAHDQLFYRGLWDTILAGHVWRGEITNRRKDGTFYPEKLTVTPVKGASGEITHFVEIKRDLTEEKRLEAQFLQAQKMESVGRLAGGIAHDFNNLLTVINGTAELALMDLKEDDPLCTNLHDIGQAGARAASLTRQLLAFSRKQTMKFEVLNLGTLVADLQGMLQRLIRDDIALVVMPAKNVGSVMADAGQMEQVIMNLTVNAGDAMPDGGTLTIETRDVELDETFAAEHPTVQPGPHVMLAVSDTGVGMEEATRRQVFEPFFTTKEVGKGTGLGLSTVYGVIKQSNGSIWVDSELGKGTTFKIYLPRSNSDVPLQVFSPVISAPVKRASETVLLVEDEDGVRKLSKHILSKAGYRVLEAANGDDAERLFVQYADSIDLVVADVIMPGCGGPELLTRLRIRAPALRVLYMSGYADESTAQKVGINRGVPFVQKPYTATEFVRQVREALDR